MLFAPDKSIAQPVALSHGHIVGVGDDAWIRRLIEPKTHVIQLQGNQNGLYVLRGDSEMV